LSALLNNSLLPLRVVVPSPDLWSLTCFHRLLFLSSRPISSLLFVLVLLIPLDDELVPAPLLSVGKSSSISMRLYFRLPQQVGICYLFSVGLGLLFVAALLPSPSRELSY
jgi:hypothetical protein